MVHTFGYTIVIVKVTDRKNTIEMYYLVSAMYEALKVNDDSGT